MPVERPFWFVTVTVRQGDLADPFLTSRRINLLGFPDAPLEIPVGPMMVGRAWFPIANEILEQAMVQGKDAVYLNPIPDGMQVARYVVEAC